MKRWSVAVAAVAAGIVVATSGFAFAQGGPGPSSLTGNGHTHSGAFTVQGGQAPATSDGAAGTRPAERALKAGKKARPAKKGRKAVKAGETLAVTTVKGSSAHAAPAGDVGGGIYSDVSTDPHVTVSIALLDNGKVHPLAHQVIRLTIAPAKGHVAVYDGACVNTAAFCGTYSEGPQTPAITASHGGYLSNASDFSSATGGRDTFLVYSSVAGTFRVTATDVSNKHVRPVSLKVTFTH